MSMTTVASSASASADSGCKCDATQLSGSLTADYHAVPDGSQDSRSQSPDSILSSDEEETWSSVGGISDSDCIVPDVKRSSANMFSAVLKQNGYLEQLLEHADCLGSAGCDCEFCFLERGGLL